MKKNNLIKKGLVVAVILLFFSVSVIPSTGDRVSFDDTTPPVTTCTLDPPEPDGDNGWYISNVTVTLNATDDLSGVNVTYYRINNGTLETYTEPFKVKADGIHLVEFYSVDNAGNKEEVKSAELYIDQTKPEIVLHWEAFEDGDIWYLSCEPECSDAMSGINRVEYYVNDELKSTVDTEPYYWIWEYSYFYSVVGLIRNPEITDEYVRFYAMIVIISEFHPDICAYVYDNAGNWDYDCLGKPLSPVDINPGIYLFQNLTLPNDYGGYVGRFFIFANFYEF